MGAKVDARDDHSNQPLHCAATRGFTAIIELLLRCGAEIDAKGPAGSTPVHMALTYPKALSALLRKDPILTVTDDNGDAALHLALSQCNLDAVPNWMVKKLLAGGADVNQLNASGTTPFHMVLIQGSSGQKGHESFLTLLLENNANININTKDGKYSFKVFLDRFSTTSLWPDDGSLQSKIFELFLKKGANPNTRLESGEPLFHAALSGVYSVDGEKGLLDNLCELVDIDQRATNVDSHLHKLVRMHLESYYSSWFKWLEDLLGRGADPNSINHAQESPIFILLNHNGYTYQTEKNMEILISNGADEMRKHRAGHLPLYLAAQANMGEKRETLTKILMDSFVRRSTIEARQLETKIDNPWWIVYHSLHTTKRWSTSTCNDAFHDIWPEHVADFLPKCLMISAAEDILSYSKGELTARKAMLGLQHEDTMAERDHYLLALRDCKSLNLELEPMWYHFLLELFE